MRFAKKPVVLLVAYLFCFTLVLLTPEHIHRQDFDRAFSAWQKNPSTQNEEALRFQQHQNEIIHLADSGIAAFALLVGGYGIYLVVRLALRPKGRDVSRSSN